MTVATSAERCCRVNERGWSLHLYLSPTAVRVRSPGVAAVDHTKNKSHTTFLSHHVGFQICMSRMAQLCIFIIQSVGIQGGEREKVLCSHSFFRRTALRLVGEQSACKLHWTGRMVCLLSRMGVVSLWIHS